jgi:HAD superfamily hydrolase (TIGR01450 family)
MEEDLVLAGMTAVEVVARDYRGARVLVVGSPSLVRAAGDAGIDLADERVDLVLLGRDEQFTYDKLARMANEINRGAMLVATNPDGTHPGSDGRIVPETGALLDAVLSCAAPRTLRVIGKPQPTLFEEALRRLDASPANCVMVGDNPHTDVAGAGRLGIETVLVGKAPGAHAAELGQLIDRLAPRRAS